MLLAAGEFSRALQEIGRIEETAVLTEVDYQIRDALVARVKERMGDNTGAAADYRAALPVAESFRNRNPESWRAYPTLARIYAALDRKDEALAAMSTCLELLPTKQSPWYATTVTLRSLVEVQSRCGLIDEALAIVREQSAAGMWRRNELRLCLEYHWLRQDPRFQAIIDRAPL